MRSDSTPPAYFINSLNSNPHSITHNPQNSTSAAIPSPPSIYLSIHQIYRPHNINNIAPPRIKICTNMYF